MNHREIYIAPQSEGKGRTFRSVCLTTVEADTLWEGGAATTDNMRPVLAVFAGSDAEIRPFLMNLLQGRKASFASRESGYRKKEDRLEILKSSKFQVAWQREAEGTLATVFLPELFRMDPGMVDPVGAKFVLLPTHEWVKGQKIDCAPIVRHVRRLLPKDKLETIEALSVESLTALVPLAFLFVAFLDRRTRCPILQDGRFYLQLLVTCLAEGLATWSTPEHSYRRDFGQVGSMRFRVEREAEMGFVPGLAFSASHQEIQRVLAEQTTIFFKVKR